METHNVQVKYYSDAGNTKIIEVSADELLILERNKALSSNVKLERSVMSKLTGLSYRKKLKIILITEVKILLSMF